MLGLSTKRTIEINGEECLVTCVHQYQEVWIATGVFDGKFLHQNGSSEELAFAMWEKEARSFLNLL